MRSYAIMVCSHDSPAFDTTAMNTISQSILPSSPIRTVPVRQSTRRQAGDTARLLAACNESYLGISTKLSADGKVDFVAFATPIHIFVVSSDTDSRLGLLPSDQEFASILLGTTCVLIGFDMGKLALQIHRDMGLPVSGIDLSTLFSPNTRDPWSPAKFIATKVFRLVNRFEVNSLWSSAAEQSIRYVCLRAWLSACAAAAVSDTSELKSALKVDTRNVSNAKLSCLGELLRQSDLLEVSKPSESPNEFSQAKQLEDGNISLLNARYRNRVRRSHQNAVILTNESGREFFGRARSAVGKTTTIKLADRSFTGNLRDVRVVGRQEPTNSEKARDEFLLHVLQGQKQMSSSMFTQRLWFPSHRKRRSGNRTQNPAAPLFIPNLNRSQVEAVSAMVSEPLVIVHGPPGTGKTTTISEAVAIWAQEHVATWVVAHSNVAVKNIAEKLHKRAVDFRILVSKEFHFEWHEHLYEKIQDKLIRSDELPHDLGALERSLGDTCIMLSTLSMLSNPALDIKGVFKIVPVLQLVVDEASQINLFDFMHLFEKYKELRKVCFFGDPNQLPPYGKEKVPGLQTIFDLEHINVNAKFLNVQYRMPVPLGQFISRRVYNGNLESQHKLHDKSCLSFVDASNGEEIKAGFSWKNLQEIQTVVHLVRSYYKGKDFCVITPYDAQRAAIESRLKSEGLPWERVFNVDSFQGNEADYVLISVVRSSKPGFLTSLNRVNVMLTRCRAGLVIVTKSPFLHDGGRHTLLGSLAQHWEDLCGIGMWIDWRLVAEGKADLPGSPAPARLQPHVPQGLRGFSMNAHVTPCTPQTTGAAPLLRAGIDAEATFTGTLRLSWAQIAAPGQSSLGQTDASGLYPAPISKQHLPKISSAGMVYREASSVPNGVSAGTHLTIPEQSNQLSTYKDLQHATYESIFPSLGTPRRPLEPTTGPQHPTAYKRTQKRTGHKVSPLIKGLVTRVAPQIVVPPPPPFDATVERISPRVIRIIHKKLQTDEARNA